MNDFSIIYLIIFLIILGIVGLVFYIGINFDDFLYERKIKKLRDLRLKELAQQKKITK